MEQPGVDALLPGPPLVHQRHVQPALGADLEHVGRRDPRLRKAPLGQQLTLEAGVGPVGRGPLLAAPLGGGVQVLERDLCSVHVKPTYTIAIQTASCI